ncbi:MBOAT family O-acyltransferase [Campylobacter portucalensis]|uniref:MBOAT family O-acyltransferase n=1 Tax=Campylobacter portucalensis TaxID=2608384 RepID=UPI002DD8374F|nr:MBOAT family O-acyltransferase [Campylobacter portucalensis]
MIWQLHFLFNIKLPLNFNSPYKALNIRDFWRRWHITLGRFLTKYLYFPLGGSRAGKFKTYLNLMIVFLISGLWHGAGWTFIFWGFLHGLAMVIHRIWVNLGFRMNKTLAWLITFIFVNFTWVFFRAESFSDALNIIKAMFGLNGIKAPHPKFDTIFSNFIHPASSGFIFSYKLYLWVILSFILVVGFKNSIEISYFKRNSYFYAIFCGLIFGFGVLLNLTSTYSEFIYFNF